MERLISDFHSVRGSWAQNRRAVRHQGVQRSERLGAPQASRRGLGGRGPGGRVAEEAAGGVRAPAGRRAGCPARRLRGAPRQLSFGAFATIWQILAKNNLQNFIINLNTKRCVQQKEVPTLIRSCCGGSNKHTRVALTPRLVRQVHRASSLGEVHKTQRTSR